MNNENYTKIEIVELPSKGNDLTAIVRVEKHTALGTTLDFGYGNAVSANSKEPKIIVDFARKEALDRVENEGSRDITHSTHVYADSQHTENIAEAPPTIFETHAAQHLSASSETKKYKHSETKPASEKQLRLLESMVTKSSLESLTESMFNKDFYQISSADANNLIKHLKKQ